MLAQLCLTAALFCLHGKCCAQLGLHFLTSDDMLEACCTSGSGHVNQYAGMAEQEPYIVHL